MACGCFVNSGNWAYVANRGDLAKRREIINLANGLAGAGIPNMWNLSVLDRGNDSKAKGLIPISLLAKIV